LDEVGDIPLEIQPKLLRALQERNLNVWAHVYAESECPLVAATNRDLEKMVATKEFRTISITG